MPIAIITIFVIKFTTVVAGGIAVVAGGIAVVAEAASHCWFV
jgi:hypothetical protein